MQNQLCDPIFQGEHNIQLKTVLPAEGFAWSKLDYALTVAITNAIHKRMCSVGNKCPG